MKKKGRTAVRVLSALTCAGLIFPVYLLRETAFGRQFFTRQLLAVLPHFLLTASAVFAVSSLLEIFSSANFGLKMINRMMICIPFGTVIYELIRSSYLGAEFRIFEAIAAACGVFVSVYICSLVSPIPTASQLLEEINEER